MLHGIFKSTFYVLEELDINLRDLDLQLTAQERTIVDNIMETETMEWLVFEFGAVGNGLIWQKHHFEMIPGQGTVQCTALHNHSK